MDLTKLFEKNHDSVIIKYVPEEDLRKYFIQTFPRYKVPKDIRDVVFCLRRHFGYDLSKVNIVPFFGTSKRNGEYSNWYPATFTLEGVTFANTEQYMMWSKAKLFHDEKIADKILNTDNPRTVKMLGREVSGFDKDIWNEKRYDIVLKGCLAKFSIQNPELHEKMLREEFPTFIEASPYDKVWGIGVGVDNMSVVKDMRYWPGTNLLGRVLTEVWDTYTYV